MYCTLSKLIYFHLYVPDGPIIAISSLGLKYAEIPLRIFFCPFLDGNCCYNIRRALEKSSNSVNIFMEEERIGNVHVQLLLWHFENL